MKKVLMVVLVLFSVATGCSAPNPQETTQTDGSSGVVGVDESLFDSEWENVDLSDSPDLSSYILYYSNINDPQAYVLMTLARHYEDAGDDLKAELDKNVENYTQTTIPYSAFESEIGDIEYFEIGGFPACAFDVTARLDEESEEFLARTVFVSSDRGIYCLQLQNTTKNYPDFSELYQKIEDSLSITE